MNTFYKNNLEKLTSLSFTIHFALSFTKPIAKILVKTLKQK